MCMRALPVSVHTAHRSQKKVVDFFRTGVSNGLELLCGAGNWTQTLWKSSQCSSQLNHLGSPLMDIFNTQVRTRNINPRLNSSLPKVQLVALLSLSCGFRKPKSGVTSQSSSREPIYAYLSPRYILNPLHSFLVFWNIPTLNWYWSWSWFTVSRVSLKILGLTSGFS